MGIGLHMAGQWLRFRLILVRWLYDLLMGLIVLMGTLAFLVFFLEGSVRLLVKLGIFPNIPDVTNIIIQVYQGSPFDIDLLGRNQIAERDRFQAEGKNFWLVEDSSTELINYQDNQRVTLFQPLEYSHTIYMFGNSTLEAIHSPDEWTIASQLQQLLNENGYLNYRIVNMGTSGYSVYTQVERLKDVSLADGDVVIFYDGCNNILFNTQFSPERISDVKLIAEEDVSLPDKVIYSLKKTIIDFFNGLAPSSYFARYIQTFRWDLYFDDFQDASKQQESIKIFTDLFKHEVMTAHDEIEQTGHQIQFIHFLQPSLFTLSNLSGTDLLLFKSYGDDYAILEMYAAFRQATIDLRAQGIEAYDLTDALDPQNRDFDDGFYFDYCHVNHEANQRIAEAIFEYLQPVLLAEE